MSPTALASLAVIVAYLIGSIPFAYVLVRLVKGIDIRTIGSGNVGATNAGRVLGKKGFLQVFLLDMLKGLVPTIALPAVVTLVGHHRVQGLAVMVALATILGHNFPIYLQFRGGKGVSTSLGATLGLDWIAGLASAVVFGVALRACRFVSLASLIGASAFVVVHFAVQAWLRKQSAWDRENVALTVLTLGLYAMLWIRHRKNLSRILDGTEPKIGRRQDAPPGRASVWILAIVAAVGLGSITLHRMTRAATLDCGEFTLVDLGHVKTGHQRATRPVFGDGGKLLAVLCPRYNRMMVYRVRGLRSLELFKEVTLDGQPTAMVGTRSGFLVLERPTGDDRHVHPGHLQAYDFDGEKSGPRIAVGFDPRDLAISADGRRGLVLTSGRAEGNSKLPPPALEILDLVEAREISHLAFERDGDRPTRLSTSSSGSGVAVGLAGTDQVAAIDLSDPSSPHLIGRSPISRVDVPYPSRSADDSILMPVASDREIAVIPDSGGNLSGHIASVEVDSSELDIREIGSPKALGRLPLRGSANFAPIRPTGVAYSPERGLIAVTSRSGGVHLIEIRRGTPDDSPRAIASHAARR
jgi:glycerol-3-phosphate acyltransferase PlsY